MFNLAHILYMVISTLVMAAILVLCGIFIKDEKYKRLVLKICAIATVVLHYSDLYIDFFTTGTATLASPHLLPMYPCNILMWLLLIVAFKKNLNSKFAQGLLEFLFYAGIVCCFVGIVFNENYASHPTLANWWSLKGLLSHSTMMLGCIYILVGKFIKIRVKSCISVFCGLMFFLLDGLIINGLYKIFKLGEPNCMYMQHAPFENMPWLTPYLMGVAGILIVFIVTAIFEQCALKKEDRWYVKLSEGVKKLKQRRTK